MEYSNYVLEYPDQSKTGIDQRWHLDNDINCTFPHSETKVFSHALHISILEEEVIGTSHILKVAFLEKFATENSQFWLQLVHHLVVGKSLFILI
jgi:hypothetical protein